MRTTVEFDDDANRAVLQLREERGLGVSQAVNELIRRGLLPGTFAGVGGLSSGMRRLSLLPRGSARVGVGRLASASTMQA